MPIGRLESLSKAPWATNARARTAELTMMAVESSD